AAGYRAVLVDRGFVAQSISARPPVDAADTTPFSLTGVFRKPDKPSFVTPPNDVAGNHWYWRDHAAMAKALRTSAPAPQVLMAETPTNPDWKALVPAPVPADIPNRHLEYALTWFGLAAALASMPPSSGESGRVDAVRLHAGAVALGRLCRRDPGGPGARRRPLCA
ncbi:MAG TPA: SURF1 family protein, partial [Phenylobacterium sp.]|nr:SURF1 family protein [Phenylobacterium sp.]